MHVVTPGRVRCGTTKSDEKTSAAAHSTHSRLSSISRRHGSCRTSLDPGKLISPGISRSSHAISGLFREFREGLFPPEPLEVTEKDRSRVVLSHFQILDYWSESAKPSLWRTPIRYYHGQAIAHSRRRKLTARGILLLSPGVSSDSFPRSEGIRLVFGIFYGYLPSLAMYSSGGGVSL